MHRIASLDVEVVPPHERLAPFLRAGQGEFELRILDGALEAAGEVGEFSAELRGALMPCLRLACATWLLPRGGLLLHGACVERNGAAHLFLGESGAGKTTLASQLDARVISDEVSCVRNGRVYGHPFTSRAGTGLAPDEGLPLASLNFLAHGARTRREALARAETLRRLLKRIFLPHKDARSLQFALDAAEAIARAPAFALDVLKGDVAGALP